MRKLLKQLFKLNKRDYIGLTCWFLVSSLVGPLAIPMMIGREIYQWRHYRLPRFEWEDIVRYTVVILLGCAVFDRLLHVLMRHW